MTNKVEINFREWLNSESGHAFIEADNSDLSIADCNRVVTLDFYCNKASSLKALDNIEYKADTLYNAVKKYRAFVKKRIKKLRKKHEGERPNVIIEHF